MTWAVLLVAMLVVATKALDCLTTLRAVGARGEGETNPLALLPMRRFGVRPVVVGVFVVAVVWTAALASVVLWSGAWWLEAAWCVVGLFVAFVQAAVAETNATGRWNVVTVRVRDVHRGLGGWIARGRSTS